MNATYKIKIRNAFARGLCFSIILISSASALFAYPNTSRKAEGTKYGLFVGINDYPNEKDKLKGAVNDAIRMQDVLVSKFGFAKENTTLMIDRDATRANILQAFEDYKAKASAGDLFVFHNSSHGTLFPDVLSEIQDETEVLYVPEYYERPIRWDNALVPVDAGESTSGKPWRNLILDDELFEIFASFTEKGIKVVVVVDACNSGSLARGAAKPKAPAVSRNLSLHRIFKANKFEDIKFSFASPPEVTKKKPSMNGLYLVLAAAKDNEFAAEIQSGEPMGLFTKNLIDLLNRSNATELSYRQLMDAIGPRVSEESLDYENDQTPQLDSRFGNPFGAVFGLN
ncbi:MAG: caspase family protein [Acidobacteriota bacterium]|nr:caspase family protein [Acidobacteriota bacterium]MDH3528162.1 caspase family protein [Acidobacteriota bacterium]